MTSFGNTAERICEELWWGDCIGLSVRLSDVSATTKSKEHILGDNCEVEFLKKPPASLEHAEVVWMSFEDLLTLDDYAAAHVCCIVHEAGKERTSSNGRQYS